MTLLKNADIKVILKKMTKTNMYLIENQQYKNTVDFQAFTSSHFRHILGINNHGMETVFDEFFSLLHK